MHQLAGQVVYWAEERRSPKCYAVINGAERNLVFLLQLLERCVVSYRENLFTRAANPQVFSSLMLKG